MKNLFTFFLAVLFVTAVSSLYAKDDKHFSDDKILITAKGTGRTTGHIADLSIKNTSDNTVTLALGPFFIFSSGTYQPYIVPTPVKVTVPAHGSNEIPLNGYCADVHTPPVPAGEDLPPFDSWITVPTGQLMENWQPEAANGWKPTTTHTGTTGILIPGTSKPLNYTIDINQHPEAVAKILLEAINRITTAYDKMKEDKIISTPFSGNPEKEREAVIQQTFWIYTAKLSGKNYVADNFRTNTIKQFESNGKKYDDASAETKQEIESGVENFWSTFEAVGVEAKVLSFSDEIDYDDITKESELPKLAKPGYQKYAAARALGSSHEKALEEAFASEDAQERWSEVFKRIYKNQGGK